MPESANAKNPVMPNSVMQETARPATTADLAVLEELATAAIAEQVDSRGGWLWSRRETRGEPFAEAFRQALENPRQGIWMGEIDGAAIGYCVAGIDTLRTGEVLGVISDLYVAPAAREVSVGEKLIAEALAWCEQHDCVGVDALALPGNRSTKNFFESFGFKARLLTVHRPLKNQQPTG